MGSCTVVDRKRYVDMGLCDGVGCIGGEFREESTVLLLFIFFKKSSHCSFNRGGDAKGAGNTWGCIER
jgi:hypothetical protein